MKYSDLFFDLDHTLWDFETNSQKALQTIYYEYNLRQYAIQSPEHFIDVYNPINYQLWAAYREGKIDSNTVKTQRFKHTFQRFGVANGALVEQVKNHYLQELPSGGMLMPNVKKVLGSLKKNYRLHVVTNGFRDITIQKMNQSQLTPFFDVIVSAEDVGVLKPNQMVFQYALKQSNATIEDSLFIGDNVIADIQGAKAIGMDQVYFNPKQLDHTEHPTYEITDMIELLGFL